MSGISMGHSNLRPCSGEKTLKRRRDNAQAENVILIDADSENNVIIIDLPESFPKKKLGSGRLRKDKLPLKNVIYIDDDEFPDSIHSIDENNSSFSAETSSNGNPCHATAEVSDSTDAAVEECQSVPDKSTPVRLAKCKRTYSGKHYERHFFGLNSDSSDSSDGDYLDCERYKRNFFGLNSDSSDSSDGDYLDCELVEDGKVQELWEKASFRRRKDTHIGCSSSRGHNDISRDIGKDQHQNARTKDVTGKHMEASFSSGKGNFNSKADPPYSFRKEDTGISCSSLFDDLTDHDFSQSAQEAHLHNDQFDVLGRSNYQTKGSPFLYGGHVDLPDCGPGCSESHIEERGEHLTSSNFSFRDDNRKRAVDNKKSPAVDTCPPNFGSCVDKPHLCSEKNCPVEDQDLVSKCKTPIETEVKPDESFPIKGANNFQKWDKGIVKENEHLDFEQTHATGSSMDKFMPEGCPFKRSTLPQSQPNFSPPRSCNAVKYVSGEFVFSRSFESSEDKIEQGYSQENRQSVSEIPLFKNSCNQTKLQEDDSLSNGQLENEDGQVHIKNGDPCLSLETGIVIDREKLKETDEYKRALEEEWASRKQALAIQAEEAQRLRQLRKRQKAESMRLLDMERRQKERLEEIRNSQKKDEENMNLKEAIRAEVRNELKKLETTCQNMASLLQLLGIHVSGWPHPLPQQVQAAYKKALLTFHPDRALKSDIRQQVEAEEKFKLINRMKEKFSLI